MTDETGYAIPCPKCLAPLQAARRIGELWGRAELLPYAAMTFDNFDRRDGEHMSAQERASLNKATKACWKFAQDLSGFLVLTGPNGNGKTHLAAAIANHVVATQAVAFTTVPDLLDRLRSTYNNEGGPSYDDVVKSVQDVPLLILDDLGAEKGNEWVFEKLFQILDARYRNAAATVITTNLDVGWLPKRIASRLSDVIVSQVVTIIAPDIRPHRGLYRQMSY